MKYEPKDEDRRREQAFERLGTRSPTCRICGMDNWRALEGTLPHILCHECAARLSGRTTVERQHPPGQRNDAETVLPTRGNDHRVWDEVKKDWPAKTLRNPDGSPLLKASAEIRTVLDWFRIILERVLGWVPEFLEWLDPILEETWGRLWWERLGWEGPQ
jgi:hypothetical protein